ncbi:MAG: S-layer homology domain-containing protein [Firmicutes bacterium]|nr:S-layer homology domain-containing protein [Bacillota bacterium]
MRQHKRRIRTIALACVVILFTQLMPVSASAADQPLFKDTPTDAWYYQYLQPMVQLGIINGYPDGTFKPDQTVTRGEFIKMIGVGFEDLMSLLAPLPSDIHWAEPAYVSCKDAEVLAVRSGDQASSAEFPSIQEGVLFPCTAQALDTPITRYEMAVLSVNTMTAVKAEPRVTLQDAASHIADYSSVSDSTKDYVEQVFGKGVINGYPDGSFGGDRTLTRAEAAKVIYLLEFSTKRVMPSFATEDERVVVTPPADFVSFAQQYATMSTSARRTALFGDPNKTYFTSAKDAGDRIVNVTVPVWTLDKSGNKVSSTKTIQVNVVVAQEVQLIFQEIYNDPEQFPIVSIGGARYSDALRHSWGCAIDINPTQNCYCRTIDGNTKVLVGSYWQPGGDQLSIKPDGSVVRAFAKYGWGWGGQGWSGGYYDYMHFSILASGG